MNWIEVVKDNPWLVPVLGAIEVLVSFATAGPIWGFFSLYVFAFLVLLALANSRFLTGRARSAPVEDGERGSMRVASPDPAAWDARSGKDLAAPLELVPELASSAATDSGFDVEDRPGPSARFASPILDAFVAATDSDPAGVRKALRKWAKRSSNPRVQKERQAQLLYWLFRAGDTSQLKNLKDLAEANPHLPELSLYLRLASPHDEHEGSWS